MKKNTIVEITALIAACNGLVGQLDTHHFGATMFLGIVALAALALRAQRTVSPSCQASPQSRTSNEPRASRSARQSSKPADQQPRQQSQAPVDADSLARKRQNEHARAPNVRQRSQRG